VILSIALSFGMVAVAINTISTVPVYVGVMLIIAIPAILIAYITTKFPTYAKPISIIFILASGAGIASYVGFGLVGPDTYLISEEVIEEIVEELTPLGPVYSISILAGSAEQGNPDYEPDVAYVPQGHVIEWVNDDELAHTVTSSLDAGDTFDSGMIDAGDKFRLDTSELTLGEYEYICLVHPWMIATIIIEEPQEPVITEVIMPAGAGIQQIGQTYYDPQDISVVIDTTVQWINEDETIHTVTSGGIDTGATGIFDSGIIDAGNSFTYTFDSVGTFDYYCIVHPWMIGSVTVE
jgi:plastocyanin